jgi:hypothetical protein
MVANSVSNTVGPVLTGASVPVPANPTNLTATVQAGPQVTLAWRDNATNETGFSVQRCTGAGCAADPLNFAEIAVAPPRNNRGNTSYVDTTVVAGTTYAYQVYAVNSTVLSALPAGPTGDVVVPAVPAAPTSFTVAVSTTRQGNNYPATLTWLDNATNETGFTVERATNLSFTTGLTTLTAPANPVGGLTTLTDSLRRNTTYYYRVRADNTVSGPSVWVNALPFPIRTGP